MIALFPLLLIVIIGSVVYGAVHSRERVPRAPRPAPAPRPPSTSTDDLVGGLARWVSAGLLSDAQARAIEEHERPAAVALATRPALPAPPESIVAARRPRVPAVAEALGYLGGVLAIIGLVLLVAQYWTDMGTAGRAGLSGGAAAVLVIAGVLVHEELDPALARLRWFLWLLGTAATALCVGVIVRDGFDVEQPRRVACASSAAVAALSGVLWRWRERPVQQLTCLAGLAVFTGTLVSVFGGREGASGLAVWALGLVVVAAALREWTPLPMVTAIAGAVTLSVGATFVITQWQGFGLLMAVVTGMMLLALAVVPGLAPTRPQQITMAAVGALLLLQTTPATLVHFAHDAGLTTGLVLWLIGAALVTVGARTHIRMAVLAELVGGLAIIGGAALTGVQYRGFAPLFGIATALTLVALGMIPGRVLMSILGSVGLLINVPWAIGWFFPGEGRAPLLILVSGALVIAVAVLLTRMSGRVRSELRGGHHGSVQELPASRHGHDAGCSAA